MSDTNTVISLIRDVEVSTEQQHAKNCAIWIVTDPAYGKHLGSAETCTCGRTVTPITDIPAVRRKTKENPRGYLFQKGNPGSMGRPKGVPNRVHSAAKTAIADAADRIGGAARLASWALETKKNECAFWTLIYPRLLPHEVTGPGGSQLMPAAVTFIITKAANADVRD